MGISLKIDLAKQDGVKTQIDVDKGINQILEDRHKQIIAICEQLSVSTQKFDPSQSYNKIVEYIEKYGRWLYSDISGYLFACDESTAGTFSSNLDSLQVYAYGLGVPGKQDQIKRMIVAIDKLWDHSNLAQKQNSSLHDNDEIFKERFEKILFLLKQSFQMRLRGNLFRSSQFLLLFPLSYLVGFPLWIIFFLVPQVFLF